MAIMMRMTPLMLGAMLGLGIASPAVAKTATSVVTCGPVSCLKVSGTREDAAQTVAINGQNLAVQGGRRWQARIPVAIVRRLSAPNARSVEIAVGGRVDEVALPIGLLGQPANLAMLVVRVK